MSDRKVKIQSIQYKILIFMLIILTNLLTASEASFVSIDLTVATSKFIGALKPSLDIVEISDSNETFELPFIFPLDENNSEIYGKY